MMKEKTLGQQTRLYNSEDVHQALFEEAPEPRTLAELNMGVAQFVKARYSNQEQFGKARPEGAEI